MFTCLLLFLLSGDISVVLYVVAGFSSIYMFMNYCVLDVIVLPVCPMYLILQVSHFVLYTPLIFISLSSDNQYLYRKVFKIIHNANYFR